MTTQAEMERAIRAGKKAGATRVLFDGGRIVFDLNRSPDGSQPDSDQSDEWSVDYDDDEAPEICSADQAA